MTPKILLVDDEPHILRIMQFQLERQGYEVITASNGEDAFGKIGPFAPDVVITDIQMPRMTGEQLCKKIAAEIPDRKFLIILLTSRTEIEHRLWSNKFKDLWFYEKPLSIRQLSTRLNRHFNLDETQE